jgi:predicted peroxiredoxin
LAAIIAGGKVTLCTQCAVRRGITEKDLLPGINIAGAASFLAEIIEPDVQALVY